MKMIAGKLAINNRAFLAVLTLVGVAVSMMSFHEGRFIALSMIGIAGFYFIVYLIVRNTLSFLYLLASTCLNITLFPYGITPIIGTIH